MIIGISGYAGSGKDTVANIIRYLGEYPNSENRTDPHLGYRSYNSFVMDMGMDEHGDERCKWKIRKWAGKLKQIASILTGIPVENFEDQEFKKTEMGAAWGMSVREFLQKLGCDGLRDNLHKEVWVNALMSDYYMGIRQVQVGTTPENLRWHEEEPHWIISDTRFPNEAEAIKREGGIIIRVDRPQKHYKSVGIHPSETALDNWDFDTEIHNTRTVDDLIPKVKWIMETYNLL